MSQQFFTARFAERKIDADYTKHELSDIAEVVPLLDTLDGINVTSPYKQAVMPYLDSIDPAAEAIGAVNVVYHRRGYNTDWVGVTKALTPHIRKRGEQALVLGSGGAANAVKYALQKMGAGVTIVSRQQGKGDMTYAELTNEVIAANRIIVNCTPLGMFPLNEETPELPWDGLSKKHLLFDCIYNPEQTVFLTKGKEHGAETLNGYSMLLGQAEAAAEIFEL